jgi:FKBP-type peptidyl-prolyl cis-trans isomerase
MKRSLKVSVASSFVVTSLLLATGCSDKEQCSLENSEINQMTSQQPSSSSQSPEMKETPPMQTEETKKPTTKIKTDSGLSYEIIKEGDPNSATPKHGSVVTVNYTGWLAKDGKVFDSSLKPGREPFQFPLGMGHVIAGWDEGVAGMRRGEIRRLHIPSKLGYGASGASPVIPPFSDLVFDVELINFK